MVKSLRYDQEIRDNPTAVVVSRLWRIGNTHAHADSHEDAAPDGNTAPHGHADTRADLPATESGGGVGAARAV